MSGTSLAAPAAPPRPGLWQRLFRGTRRLRQRPDWGRLAGGDWADRLMDVAVTDRFHAKQGRSTGRWVLREPGPGEPGLTVYLKRHYQLPWWLGWAAALWPGRDWSPAMQEWAHLEWARKLGRRGWGHVHPNPLVGCVIVNENRTVGEGFHQVFGGPHAEIVALEEALTQARGGTVYVSLEPCNHHGKTPPCTDAVLRSGEPDLMSSWTRARAFWPKATRWRAWTPSWT